MSSVASRASWGARYRNGVGNRPLGNLDLWFHHTVTTTLSPNATVAQERAQMRVIESIGQNRFGAGISYNYLVFPSGRIYEGASIGRIAYHTGGSRNVTGAAICLVGNYEANRMTRAQEQSVAWLMRRGRTRNHWRTNNLRPHQTVSSTACPGRYAIGRVSAIQNLSASGGGSTPEDDMATAKEIANYLLNVQTMNGFNEDKEYGMPPETLGRRFRRIGDRAGRAVVLGRRAVEGIASLEGKVAGLDAKVDALANNQGIDPAEVERIVRESTEAALREATEDLSITLSVDSPDDGSAA